MRICRYDDNRLGVVRDDMVHDVTELLQDLPRFSYPLPDHDPLIAALPDLRPRIEALADRAATVAVGTVRLLPPVASPRKIIGAPVNYRLHHEEALADPNVHHGKHTLPIDKAGLFLKATSSLIGASDRVILRHPDRRNDHEVELVVVIGRRADRVARQDALAHVAGYCVGLDMTVRGTEERSMRKSIDTYSVLGPWLVTADEIADPSDLMLELSVNGEVRQRASTAALLRDVAELIAWASSFYTLMPGDLIYTGTPEGVSEVRPGDVMRASVQLVGSMSVEVA